MLSMTALYGSGVARARRVVNRVWGGVFRRWMCMEDGGFEWTVGRSSVSKVSPRGREGEAFLPSGAGP